MPEVNAYIEQGNRVLGALGFTEHSRGHAVKVAETAGNILEKLGYNQHTIELARIAGYMHDMGNCVNRVDHAQNFFPLFVVNKTVLAPLLYASRNK